MEITYPLANLTHECFTKSELHLNYAHDSCGNCTMSIHFTYGAWVHCITGNTYCLSSIKAKPDV